MRPLTARPIAKVNDRVCTNSVLIITKNVHVSIVSADIVDKLFKIKNCVLIVLFDRCSVKTMNTGGATALVVTTRVLSQLVRSPFDIVPRGITRFYEPDQFLRSRNLTFLLLTRIKGTVVLFSIFMLIGVGNVLVALMYFLCQLLEISVRRPGRMIYYAQLRSTVVRG